MSGIKDFAIGIRIKAYDGVSKVFSSIGRRFSEVQLKATRVNHAMENYLKRSKERSESMDRGFGRVAQFVTIAGIVEFAHKATEAYNEMLSAVANVEAGLESTHHAVGFTIDELTEKSDRLMKKSIFQADEILQNVTAQLVTFTNISGTSFDRAQEAALDVTSKLKGLKATGDDLKTNAIKIARALNDPIKGMGGLSKMGINFTASQLKMIRYFTLTGETAKAQTIILDEIGRRFGNTASKIAETAGGKEKQIANELRDTMERIGKTIGPLEIIVLSFANSLLSKLALLFDWIEKNKVMVGNIGGAVIAFAGATFIANKAMAAFIAVQKVMIFSDLIGKILLATKGLQGMAAVQAILNVLWTANPVGLIIVGIGLLAAAAFLVIKNWKPISEFFVKLWGGIVDAVKPVLKFLWGALDNKLVQAAMLFFMPWVTVPILIVKNWKGIVSFFKGVFQGILKAIPEPLLKLFQNPDSKGMKLENKLIEARGPAISSRGSTSLTQTEAIFTRKEKQEITVRFDNLPRGTKVDSTKTFPGLDLSMGYSNAGF